MTWMTERDALIAQTMAFVRLVTGKKDEAGKPGALDPAEDRPAQAAAETSPIEATLSRAKDAAALPQSPPLLTPPPRAARVVAQPVVPSDMKNEIRSRVASFRAHQERFNRERAEYFSATLERLRASIDDAPPPPPGK
jgi:hypothetical protein